MRRGFTLIELLVVISIISLLSSIVLGSINEARAKARDSKRIQDLLQVQKALELYASYHDGHYPPDPVSSGDGSDSAGNPFPGVTCWECSAGVYGTWIYDPNRLAALRSPVVFLSQSPCDPLSNRTGSTCLLPTNDFNGFMYKTNSSLYGQLYGTDYRLYLLGTMETNNIPTSLKYTGNFSGTNQRSIAVSSSANADTWDVLCAFSGDGDFGICQ